MPFQEGEQVNGYTVMEQLGRGGMATVFKAYHASLDRYVALKVMHPAFMEDANFLARFQREARVVAKLEHPNIIPVYDFSEHEGRTYLVMKYVEGKTLKGRLMEGPIPPDEGLKIIGAIGDGLAYAHKQGVLHRDIKPSNIILADDGQIYLADFGLARIASAGESTLSSDMMIGTPQYISPEQALGERDLGPATDVYSFGVVIYELVVGKVPYSSDTPFSVVHDHIYKPLPLPRAVNSNVPESMERVLLKALAKDPGDRFQNVDEMVGAFKKSVQGDALPEVDHVPSTPTPTPTPVPSTVASPSEKSVDASATQTQIESQEKKKRKFKWWYIPLLLAFCLCSLFVLSRNSDNDQPGLFGGPQNQSEFDQTLEANIQDNIEESLGANELDNEEPQQPGDVNQRVEDAERTVEENPEDAFAYLDLAVAYIEAGDQDKAAEAYEQGQILAGDDPGFYVTAGDLLASRGFWLQALEQYVQAMDYSDLENDEVFVNKLRQAVYKAVENPDSKNLFDAVDAEEEPIVRAANARYILLHPHDPEQALALIDEVLEENPNFPDAQLIKAEIFMHLDQPDEAERILGLLTHNNEVPSWIKVEARSLLNEIP